MIGNLCYARQKGINHAEFGVQGNVVGVVATCCHASSRFEKHIGAIVEKSSRIGIDSERRWFLCGNCIKVLLVARVAVCYPSNHICVVHVLAVTKRHIGISSNVGNILNFITTWKVGYLDRASIFI